MKYELIYNGRFFEGIVRGDGKVQQFAELVDLMFAHEAWKPGGAFMHDLSELNAGPLTVDDVQKIADNCVQQREQFGACRCAVVVDRDLELGLTNMWAVFVHGKWDAEVQIFRTHDEAAAWLDESPQASDG